MLHKAWQPAFSPASLAGYLPLMDQCARKLADSLIVRAAVGGAASGGGQDGVAGPPVKVDLHRELGRMTLQVVGSCAYGVDFATLDDNGDQVERSVIKAISKASSGGEGMRRLRLIALGLGPE